ncbi:glycoside hydrolase family 16 protein [Pleomassaria siparia CBS 279.74]|uniref:Crh-like protein n=1 Tax=Pleomassaria siparia CBS 279.74 TaxID=1314801 RepID=A0A6G1KS48_9PLEO|nr:glycoside hydrolase family 16 protein [Pleomassaria siparia CBS 279.74]
MRFTSYIGASAIVAFASAQTFTECNPTEKECPNNPAMAATLETNFKAGADSVKGWKQTAGKLEYVEAGADFTLAAKGDAPTIQTEGYLHFGLIEVKARAAAGQGVISSIVLQSEDLDEVDWEFIGGVPTEAQMNYFGKGNVTTYDRMTKAPVATPMDTFHTYALNWTAESLTWIIDSVPVRTLNFADANGGKNYPQTPSTVRIGIWAGGDPANSKGTIEWAGGEIDYTKGPYKMTVESVKITNYSPGTEYKWTDKSGSYQSIEVIDAGNVQGAPINSVALKPTATATGGGLQDQVNVPNATSLSSPYGNNTQYASKPTSACGTSTITLTLSGTQQPPAPTGGVATPPAATGIVTDTAPAPTAPQKTPTPSSNSTTSAPPEEFTAAASHNKVGAFVGLMAGAAILLV